MRRCLALQCALGAGLLGCGAAEPAPIATPAPVASVVVPQPSVTAGASSSAVAPEEPAPASMTPLFVPRFALATPAAEAEFPMGGETLFLFESEVDCAVLAAGDTTKRVSLSPVWKVGHPTRHAQMSVEDGVTTSYQFGVEVLAVPVKGKRGRIRIEPHDGGNVEGGELDVTWCE